MLAANSTHPNQYFPSGCLAQRVFQSHAQATREKKTVENIEKCSRKKHLNLHYFQFTTLTLPPLKLSQPGESFSHIPHIY